MAETLAIGRQAQLYVKAESTYGTAPTFAAANAMRHTTFSISRPTARINSPEKKFSPGVANRFSRRSSASWNLEALLRPSGTINTLPEADPLFVAALSGTPKNTALSTTVSASPAPTATGCTVASATGLAVGSAILITGADSKKYVRIIKTLATAAITWEPALPAAPTAGNAVKAALCYNLGSTITGSIAAELYLTADTTHSYLVTGAVVEKLALAFAQNEEIRLMCSGAAKAGSTPAAAKPAGFTTVGTQNPPSGLTGELVMGATYQAYRFIKADIEMQTGVKLRDNSFGYTSPEGILLTERRLITVGIDALVGDESVIYDLAEAETPLGALIQCGWTEGNIVGVYLPKVDFDIPDNPGGDDVPTWSFKGQAMESADQANDELYVIFA